MQADQLQGCVLAATREKDPDTGHWYRFIDLVHTEFRDGLLPTKCTWQTVIFLPKGNRYFRSIGLVEVLWKAVSGVIKQRITSEILYQDVLHIFRVGRGTGIAYLVSNNIKQIAEMREEVLYKIFLYLRKVYDALDRERCLNILVAYWVRP